MHTLNKIERIKMVKAMEFIMRQLNDEDIFMSWLYNGVADGDIEYGDFNITNDDIEYNFDFYIQDDEFADLMYKFSRLIARSLKSGGLYCDGVVSTSAQ